MAQEKDVRTKMLQALLKYNIKQVDVARQAGIHHSTLSLWLQGKVKGHNIGIEDTLNQWLENLYSGKHRYTTLNKTNDKQFILTPPALNIKRKKNIDCEEILIPVHLDLDLEIEGRKYKEVFCWNISDPYYTPQEYAHLIVQENTLLSLYQTKIVEAIRKAISYYHNKLNKNNKKQYCLKTLIINIKINNICLKDTIQWDIFDQNNCPQDFAYSLCKQLNLNGQFMVKVAHQIRQQVQFHRKEQNSQHQYNNKVQQLEPINNNTFLDIKRSTRNLISFSDNYDGKQQEIQVTANNYIRYNNPCQWQPSIEILDAGEIRKFQKFQQRKNRYARRAR